MRRNYSMLGLMSIVTLLCANALIGCYGGSWGQGRCGASCPRPGGLKEGEKQVTSSLNLFPIISPPLIIEEFIYTGADPLNGLNGGIGWAGPWSTVIGEFDISTSGLEHPAQATDTGMAGNNKVSGVISGGADLTAISSHPTAPRLHTMSHALANHAGITPTTTSFEVATRDLNPAAVTLVNNALNSPGGLWFRWLMSIPGSPGVGAPTFAVDLGSTTVVAAMSAQAGAYAFAFDSAPPMVVSHTIEVDASYMFVVNISLTDSTAGTFSAKLWVLDPITNGFGNTITPVVITGTLGTLPIKLTSVAVAIADGSNDSFDEIYMANSPQGLGINML